MAVTAYIPVRTLPKGTAPRRRAGIVLLGENNQGLVEVLNDRPGAGALPFMSKYTRVIAVATGAKTITWAEKLPSADQVREFTVQVTLRVSPVDPTRLGGASDYDFAPDIVTETKQSLHPMARKVHAADAATLEDQLNKWAFGKVLIQGNFKIDYGAFFVSADEDIRDKWRKTNDATDSHSARMLEVQRRTDLARFIVGFLPNTPVRNAVAFDLAKDPSRIVHYIDRIEKAHGEQQRLVIQQLEKLADIFRNGNLDSVDVATLVAKVVGSNEAGAPALPNPPSTKYLTRE